MKAIYFGQDLCTRCSSIGVLCRDDGYWIGIPDILDALDNGEDISIRNATETEMKRAEALAKVHECGLTMGHAMGELYKNQGLDAVEDAVFGMHQAIMSVELPPCVLVDQE